MPLLRQPEGFRELRSGGHLAPTFSQSRSAPAPFPFLFLYRHPDRNRVGAVAAFRGPFHAWHPTRSTITTNSTRHLFQPPSQQTRQPAISSSPWKSRRNFVSTYIVASVHVALRGQEVNAGSVWFYSQIHFERLRAPIPEKCSVTFAQGRTGRSTGRQSPRGIPGAGGRRRWRSWRPAYKSRHPSG
jgi:hypothetical protein